MSRPASRSSSASSNNQMKLPPIITNEADRLFLIDLKNYIDAELASVGTSDPEARFTIYKDAFNLLIDHLPGYKPLLSRVKAEYEDCISTIVSGGKEARYLYGKVHSMALEGGTLHNFQRRMGDLQGKVSVINDDNERLRQEIKEIREARERKAQAILESQAPDPSTARKEPGHIPGLTVKEATDPAVLTRELESLERQIKDLNIAHKTRYMPKETKTELKAQLDRKVIIKNELDKEAEVLKMKLYKMKVATEAAEAWNRLMCPPQTIGEAVVSSLNKANKQAAAQQADQDVEYGGLYSDLSVSVEDDDPTREKEAEVMLEYIEKFNELFEDDKFREAALHAANSPKGILRTLETLRRLQSVVSMDKSLNPALTFCEALVSTVPAFGTKPNAVLSSECTTCALKELKHDLVFHWISQDRLTLSSDIARNLEEYSSAHPQSKNQCMALVQQIYMQLEEHYSAAKCMLSQGRVKQAIKYAKSKGKLSSEDYRQLLAEYPTVNLAQALLNEHSASLGDVVELLYRNGSHAAALKIVVDIFDEKPDNEEVPKVLREAILQDKPDYANLWLTISDNLKDQSFIDCAVEVRAAAFVLETLKNAKMQLAGSKQKKQPSMMKKSSVKFIF